LLSTKVLLHSLALSGRGLGVRVNGVFDDSSTLGANRALSSIILGIMVIAFSLNI
jgi:hypothetical protein